MDPKGQMLGLGSLSTQREYFFRGDSKTNKALPIASAQISARSYMFWTSNGRVIPEQLFLQKSNLEIQQKANLVLFQSNTAPHTATHTCPGSIHFTQITSQIGAAIVLTQRKAN